MITGEIIHPEIISGLAAAGHGSYVLITDGHYSSTTNVGPNAKVVFLNLCRNLPNVTQVLEPISKTIAIEAAFQIQPAADALPSVVQEEVRDIIDESIDIELVERFDFYDLVRSQNTALVIVTGDTRRFGNVLLRVGVLKP